MDVQSKEIKEVCFVNGALKEDLAKAKADIEKTEKNLAHVKNCITSKDSEVLTVHLCLFLWMFANVESRMYVFMDGWCVLMIMGQCVCGCVCVFVCVMFADA